MQIDETIRAIASEVLQLEARQDLRRDQTLAWDSLSHLRLVMSVEEEFGIRYHKDHVSRLLRELHWTPQVPMTRAIQRDEEAIARWRDDVWPDLRRQARRERRVLVFVDEAGSYLLPGVVRTYAPEGPGQTHLICKSLPAKPLRHVNMCTLNCNVLTRNDL